MDFAGKQAVVVGLGASGRSAASLLLAHGAQVVLNDQREDSHLNQMLVPLTTKGARPVLGNHPDEIFRSADLIVISPGVPSLPAVEAAKKRGARVWSEIELASRFIRGKIVAVTGTNGKSTVTTLVGAMCQAMKWPTFVGGNLGEPLSEAVTTPAAEKDGVLVVEVSSFQLEAIESFHPQIAVLLNISPDHLDRYPSYQAYARAKLRIFENQTANDVAILPSSGVEADLNSLQARRLFYGAPDGIVRTIGTRIEDTERKISIARNELPLVGRHNVENACAAWLIARELGVDAEVILHTLRSFRGLPHRMQRVAEHKGVVYVDDSKATNVGAGLAALQGLELKEGRVVLIAGGRDKGASYQTLRAELEERGRALVTLGEAAPLIEKCFGASQIPYVRAKNMEEAVQRASGLAKPGDIVLLAPACSSYDMFESYIHRGRVFQDAVQKLLATT